MDYKSTLFTLKVDPADLIEKEPEKRDQEKKEPKKKVQYKLQ